MAVNIVIRTDFDSSGIKEAETGLQKLGDIATSAFKFLAAGAGIAAAGIAKFAGDAIKQASDLSESTNAVNVAFGESAKAVLEIGKNSATSLGLAQTEFNQAAVRFSAFAERIAGSGGSTAKVIEDLSTRAADFASVFNIEVSEAMATFQSGLSGEAEPLKRFGINLLEAEVKAYALRAGIIGVGESMDENQKVQARFGLLMEATAKTAGDFANTSDGLANSQRILKAQFTDLQAEIGEALLPAFTTLIKTIADALMPRLKEIGQFLNSPQGKKAIEDTAKAITDFALAIINNIDGITRLFTVLLTVTGAIVGFRAAAAAATTAQLLFNTAVATNPYVLAVTALVAFTAAVVAFADMSDDAAFSAQKQSYQVQILEAELANLNKTVASGAGDQEEYKQQLESMQQRLNSAKISIEATAGELRRFNSLRLDDAIASMNAFKNATTLASRQAKSFGDSYSYLESIGAVTKRVRDEATAITETAASTGPSAFEQARQKVQELIKSAQKSLADAQDRYNDQAKNARENYANNILSIEKDFANRLANIIQQSQDRLRSAYRSAVEENIAALFDRSEDKSVEGLVKSLSDKLTASRQLLANSAQLASEGFSQTFIEQVVSAGTETGNELAAAILNSTPETKNELQKLFSALEVEASSGMDSLAKEIYDKQGLATKELKNLYTQTGLELEKALLDQQSILARALEDAATALYDSVVEIRKNFSDEIDKMGDKLGGMGTTIKAFLNSLGITETKALEDAINAAAMPGGSLMNAESVTVAAADVARASGILIDSVDDIADVYDYLGQRIQGAEKYLAGNLTAAQRESALATLSELRGAQATIYGAATAGRSDSLVGTVININVRADTSQSLAMVGKSLGNTVAKYVTGGGQVIVSPV